MSGRRAKKLRSQTAATVAWVRRNYAADRPAQFAWVWQGLSVSPPGWRRQIGRLLRAGLRTPKTQRLPAVPVEIRSVWDEEREKTLARTFFAAAGVATMGGR